VASAQSSELRALNLGDAAQIDGLIDSYRSILSGQQKTRASSALIADVLQGSDEEIFKEVGIQLRMRLLDPVLQHIGSCRTVLIAPDGDINELPFEILPGVDGRPLVAQ